MPVQTAVHVNPAPAVAGDFASSNPRANFVGDHAFPSLSGTEMLLSTRQYARLADEWVSGIGLRQEDYGTHSLRPTKESIIYKATGNLRAVQTLLGHTRIEGAVRYLGIDVEDALALAEHTDAQDTAT